MASPWNLITALLVILCTCSIALTYSLYLLTRDVFFARSAIQPKDSFLHLVAPNYTFIGDDFPVTLPITLAKVVEMEPEESVHYSPSGSEGSEEWKYIRAFGTNTVQLGPEKRAFALSFIHEMHCVDYLGKELLNVADGRKDKHTQHCINYLRQVTLCHADVTLERGDFAKRNFTEERVGETRVCRDWDAGYDALNVNWIQWYEFRKENGISADLEVVIE